MERASARALLIGVVDYAGLFPPAAVSMRQAIEEYRAAQQGADAWMLGRFVVPAVRLSEFAELGSAVTGGVRMSAIVRDRSAEDRTSIDRFNGHAAHSAAAQLGIVDAVECKPQSLDGIDWLADNFAAGVEVYVEISVADDVSRWLERVALRGLRAKVRTGGVTPDAFPGPDALLNFLATAVRLQVPFKATAGLHHALRGTYPLTYEPGTAHAEMYGYLNVLLATAALRAGLPTAIARDLLRERDASSIAVRDETVQWRSTEFSWSVLHDTRERHLVSFGSCSFREPAGEYRALAAALAAPGPDAAIY